jgi:hypothetical protein
MMVTPSVGQLAPPLDEYWSEPPVTESEAL